MAFNAQEPRDAQGRFTDGGSVGEHLAAHPKGPAHALKELAAAHKRGEIAFEEPTSGSGSKALVAAPADRASWPEHIKALALPPAWTDVRISADPEAALQAIGKDAKGRAQYVYSEAFSRSQSAAKFERITRLHAKADDIERINTEHQNSSDAKVAEHADAAALVMKMGIRPGGEGDTGADVKAYGATTLEGRHVVTEDGKTSLKFIGKKGVSLNLPVEDAKLAEMLRRRAEMAGAGGQIFPHVSAASLSDHVHAVAGAFKTKDFRTLLASRTAMREIAAVPAPKTMAAYKKAEKDVATKVSRVLGNTPSVALASYINPVVFSEWRAGLEQVA